MEETIRVYRMDLIIELAHRELIQIVQRKNLHLSEEEIEELVVMNDGDNDCTIYKDEYQDMFNDLYDEYEEFLERFNAEEKEPDGEVASDK